MASKVDPVTRVCIEKFILAVSMACETAVELGLTKKTPEFSAFVGNYVICAAIEVGEELQKRLEDELKDAEGADSSSPEHPDESNGKVS